MNCEQAKRHFIESVYGELDTRQRAPLEQHLASCEACRGKLTRLEQSRKLLDVLGEKPVRIEAEAVLERAGRRALHSSRRWRRGALATAAVAACLLAVMLSGLRVEWHATYLVVAWGNGGEDAVVEPRPGEAGIPGTPKTAALQADPWPVIHDQGKRLESLDELVRLVVAELESAERRQGRALGTLQSQFAELHRQNALRWKLLDQDVRDLGATYLAAYRPPGSDARANPSDQNEQGDRP
jgi:hypothetical protein